MLESSQEFQRLLLPVPDPQICDLIGLVCMRSGREILKILSVPGFLLKYNYELYSINFKRFVLRFHDFGS